MASIVEQAMLLSLGAAALARDRLRELVDDSVKRGRLSRDVGEELLEGFARRATTEGDELRSRVGTGLHDLARELGVVTRPEWQELQLKVAQLEHRVALLEEHETAGPAS
jgi:polyhydroxyalkanoate synthesis regulator phasin